MKTNKPQIPPKKSNNAPDSEATRFSAGNDVLSSGVWRDLHLNLAHRNSYHIKTVIVHPPMISYKFTGEIKCRNEVTHVA